MTNKLSSITWNFKLSISKFRVRSASQEALWRSGVSLLPRSWRHQLSNSSPWTHWLYTFYSVIIHWCQFVHYCYISSLMLSLPDFEHACICWIFFWVTRKCSPSQTCLNPKTNLKFQPPQIWKISSYPIFELFSQDLTYSLEILRYLTWN